MARARSWAPRSVRGASLVVWAVREGQDAAAEIDRYFKTRTEEVAA